MHYCILYNYHTTIYLLHEKSFLNDDASLCRRPCIGFQDVALGKFGIAASRRVTAAVHEEIGDRTLTLLGHWRLKKSGQIIIVGPTGQTPANFIVQSEYNDHDYDYDCDARSIDRSCWLSKHILLSEQSRGPDKFIVYRICELPCHPAVVTNQNRTARTKELCSKS